MGVSTSKPPEFNPNDRDTWWLMHVEAVFKRFKGRQLDFAVPRAEFVSLLRDTHEGVTTLVDQLWAVFDPNHCGLVNMLEVLAALSIVSCGEPQDKIRFVFALFDFEDSGTVQYDELVLMLSSALAGFVKERGRGRLPADHDMERFADEVYLSAGARSQESISKHDFVEWVAMMLGTMGKNLNEERIFSVFDLCERPPPMPVPEVIEDEVVQKKVEESLDCSGQDTDSDLEAECGADESAPVLSAAQMEAHRRDQTCGVDVMDGRGGGAASVGTSRDLLFVERDIAVTGRASVGTSAKATSNPNAIGTPLPGATLRLRRIHGWRCHDRRQNNVLILASQEVLLYSAKVVMLLDRATNRQRLYQAHTGPICAADVHPDGVVVATAQAGPGARVLLWDSATLTTLRVLRGVHARAVTHLKFSTKGAMLASVSADTSRTMQIFEWERPAGRSETAPTTPILSAPFGRRRQLRNVAFSEDDKVLLTCGLAHVGFWDLTKPRLHCEEGIFRKGASPQTIYATTYIMGQLLGATASGRMHVWERDEYEKSKTFGRMVTDGGEKKHDGALTALWTDGEILISGGKDGKVKVFSGDLVKREEFNLENKELGAISPAIVSVSGDDDGGVVVGTKGGDIFHCRGDQVSCIHQGHYRGEVRGLAVHPSERRFATCGDDGTCRLWDFNTGLSLGRCNLEAPASAIAWQPNGGIVAVATGMRCVRPIPDVYSTLVASGAVHIITVDTMEVEQTVQLVPDENDGDVREFGEQKAEKRPCVTALRFSPDGEILAIGCADARVLLVRAASGTGLCEPKPFCTIRTEFSGGVSCIDFTKDSMLLRCSGHGGRPAQCWSSAKGELCTDVAASVAAGDGAQQWATWTMTRGDAINGAQMNVARSAGPPVCMSELQQPDVTAVACTPDNRLLASGDNVGDIRLHHFPAAADTICAQYSAHTGEIRALCFSHDSSYLASVGQDGAVCVWTLVDNPDPASGVCSRGGTVLALQSNCEGHDTPTALSTGLLDTEEAQMLAAPARSALQELTNTGLRDWFAREEEHDETAMTKARPWLYTCVPPTEEPPTRAGAPPGDIELTRVYGCSTRSLRNNVRYTAADEVLFTAAAVAVLHNLDEDEQRFYAGQHTDDISALTISADGKLIATGQRGHNAELHVWDASSLECLAVIAAHRGAVTQLAFSPDACTITALGQDRDHTLSMFDWKTGVCLARTVTTRGTVLGMDVYQPPPKGALINAPAAHRAQTLVAAVIGAQFCAFFSRNGADLDGGGGQTMMVRYGAFESAAQSSLTLLVCAYDSQGMLWTGQSDGSIFGWSTDCAVKVVFDGAHAGPVTAMHVRADTLFTGGKDGWVHRWRGGKSAAVASFDGIGVTSVCAGARGILVSTESCTMWEVVGSTKALLQDSHKCGELWGLATAPKGNQFVTAGDDGILRVWDAQALRPTAKRLLGAPISSLSYHPDGTKLAVGFGTRDGGGGNKSGVFAILNVDTLEVEHEFRASQQCIHDLKWSPNGRLFAVACHDTRTRLYDVNKGYAAHCELVGHSNHVLHIDWSVDSYSLMTACAGFELLYWDAASGGEKPSGAIELRDMRMASWTCPFGWPAKGIWPSYSEGTYYTAVDRSPDDRLLAAADSYGRVKLFQHPCTELHASAASHIAHSPCVSSCRWLADSHTLISIGSTDRIIFQWKNAAMDDPLELWDSDIDEEDTSAYVARSNEELSAMAGRAHTKAPQADDGDEFLVPHPWLDTMVEPDELPSPKDAVHAPLSSELRLDAVYGIRSRDCRNNVHFLSSGELVYFIAQVVVILKHGEFQDEDTQRHYMGHTDDIISLAVHPNGYIVASGQIGIDAAIHVWDSETVSPLVVLRGHERGVAHLCFSTDGARVLSSGLDEHHSIMLHEWRDTENCRSRVGHHFGQVKGKAGGFLESCPASRDKILDVACGPAGEVCVVGDNFLKFWFDGLKRDCRSAIFGGHGKVQTCLSAVYFAGYGLVGTVGGELLLFERHVCCRHLEAHKKSVNTLAVTDDNFMLSGGKDGFIMLWDKFFNCLLNIEVKEESIGSARVTECMPIDPENKHYYPASTFRNPDAVRGVTGYNGRVALSTRQGELYCLDRKEVKAQLLMQGHCHGETWGLAAHPTMARFATCGDDRTVRVWHATKTTCLARRTLDSFARAVAWAPDGQKLAVGMGGELAGEEAGDAEGSFIVLEGDTLNVVHNAQDTNFWIQDVRWSPNAGDILAISSHDNMIYLYDAANLFQRKAVCVGHGSYITHFDFSTTGAQIQSTCGAKELLYFDAISGEQNTDGDAAYRNEEWDSWTLPIGWPVQGLWRDLAMNPETGAIIGNDDGTEVTAVDRSRNGKMVASVDNFGRLRLQRFPCIDAVDAAVDEYRGHSVGCTNCRWTAKDQFLLTTGKADQAIFQWRQVKSKERRYHAKHDDVPQSALSSDALSALSWFGFEPDIEASSRDNRRDAVSEGDTCTVKNRETANDHVNGESSSSHSHDGPVPWMIMEPANDDVPPQESCTLPTKPSCSVTLAWAYARPCMRGGVAYSAEGNIVFPAGPIGVVYCPSTHRQSFAQHNTDAILALAVSADGRFAATGELGRRPRVCVWDTSSMALLAVLRGRLSNGVTQLIFSPDGRSLACVSPATAGTIEWTAVAVYDWASESLLWEGRLHRGVIHGICFGADEDSDVIAAAVAAEEQRKEDVEEAAHKARPPNSVLYACGDHFLARIVRSGRGVRRELCRFDAPDEKDGPAAKMQTVCCVISTKNRHVWSGQSDGSLYCWHDINCTIIVPNAHSGPVLSLSSGRRSLLFSGGADGVVCMVDAEGELLRRFTLCADNAPAIRSLRLNNRCDRLLISNDCGEILEMLLPVEDGEGTKERQLWLAKQPNVSKLMEGHAKGELWALAVDPNCTRFATASDNGIVHICNYRTRQLIIKRDVGAPVSAMTFSHDGSKLALALGYREGNDSGHRAGVVLICDSHSLDTHVEVDVGTDEKCALDLKWSPNGQMLAVGCIDGNVYVLDASQGYRELHMLTAHSRGVRHIDWARDSTILQTACAGFEMRQWNMLNGTEITCSTGDADLISAPAGWVGARDMATWTCPIGWPVVGLWPTFSDDVEVMAVDRAPSGDSIACVDGFGRLKVSNFPVEKGAFSYLVMAHANRGSNCRWSADGNTIITIGDRDGAVLQWAVVNTDGHRG